MKGAYNINIEYRIIAINEEKKEEREKERKIDGKVYKKDEKTRRYIRKREDKKTKR